MNENIGPVSLLLLLKGAADTVDADGVAVACCIYIYTPGSSGGAAHANMRGVGDGQPFFCVGKRRCMRGPQSSCLPYMYVRTCYIYSRYSLPTSSSVEEEH